MERMINLTVERAGRVARFELPVYRSIALDPDGTRQAALVVAVVALASGIGALGSSPGAVVAAIAGALFGWFIFSIMTWFFGRNVFGGPTSQIEIESLLRTQGYARAPGVFAILGFLPIVGWAILFVSAVWALVTAILAIRETLAISTSRAILVAIAAAIASAIVRVILGFIFGVDHIVFI